MRALVILLCSVGCAPSFQQCELAGDVRSGGRCMRISDTARRCRRDCLATRGAAKDCLERCGSQALTREQMCAQSLLDACESLRRVFAHVFEEGEEWRGAVVCGDKHSRFTLVPRSVDEERSTMVAEIDTGTVKAEYVGGYDPATGILHLQSKLPIRTDFPPSELAGHVLEDTPRKVIGSTAGQCQIEFERTIR